MRNTPSWTWLSLFTAFPQSICESLPRGRVQEQRPKAEEPWLKIKSDPRPGHPHHKGQALNLLKAPGIWLLLGGVGEGHIPGAPADTRSTRRPFLGYRLAPAHRWGAGEPRWGRETPPMGHAGGTGASGVTHPDSAGK